MTDPLIVTIPGTPDSSLSPNARVHWAVKHKAATDYHQTAKMATIAVISAGAPSMWFASRLVLDYVIRWEKGRKRMDDDNAKALLKAVQDGIAAALGVDDRHMTVGTVAQYRDPDGVGSVTVTITPTGTNP